MFEHNVRVAIIHRYADHHYVFFPTFIEGDEIRNFLQTWGTPGGPEIYITRFPTYQAVYGTFATIPIFLLWLYLSWLMVLLGAVIAASLSSWRFREWRDDPKARGKQFFDALRLLGVLGRALKAGKVETASSLQQQLMLSPEEVERILELMMKANFVRQVQGGGWVQILDPAEIRIADVYRLFAFRPEALRGAAGGDTRLEQGDVIAVAGTHDAVDGVRAMVAPPSTPPLNQ